jgi:hypothetical protein
MFLFVRSPATLCIALMLFRQEIHSTKFTHFLLVRSLGAAPQPAPCGAVIPAGASEYELRCKGIKRFLDCQRYMGRAREHGFAFFQWLELKLLLSVLRM